MHTEADSDSNLQGLNATTQRRGVARGRGRATHAFAFVRLPLCARPANAMRRRGWEKQEQEEKQKDERAPFILALSIARIAAFSFSLALSCVMRSFFLAVRFFVVGAPLERCVGTWYVVRVRVPGRPGSSGSRHHDPLAASYCLL